MLVAVFSAYFKAAADNWPQIVVYTLTGLQIEPDARVFTRCPKATMSFRSTLLHLVPQTLGKTEADAVPLIGKKRRRSHQHTARTTRVAG